MKALRIVGIAAAVVVLLLAAAIGTLYALFDAEKIKGELTRTVQEKYDRKIELGKAELSVWPNVGIRIDGLKLSEPGGKVGFLALESARLGVAVKPLLSRQVQVQAVEVKGLKASLVKHKDGRLNIDDLLGGKKDAKDAKDAKDSKDTADKPGAQTPAEPVILDVEGIDIRNASLDWRDEKTGKQVSLSNLDLSTGAVKADSGKKALVIDKLAFAASGKSGADAMKLKLDAPRISVTPEKASGERLGLDINIAGTGRQIEARLALTGIEGSASALKIGQFTLDADIKLDDPAGATAVKAHLDSPLAVAVAEQVVTLDKLAGSIDIASPKMPMKALKLPLSGSARADLAKQSARLELATQFDESKIATKVNVGKFAPLALAFDLDIDKLNVDKYLPPKSQEAEKKANDDGKLDFSALKGLDIDGAIRIGALQVSNLKLADLNARLAIANGRLNVSPLTLKLYEGSASGSLALDANGNALTLQQNLNSISINPLLKDLADKDLIEGKGSVMLDIASRGATVVAMKQALSGKASLNLKDGAIKGINLAKSLRDIKAKLGMKQDAEQQANSAEKTDFSELAASFKIASGVAHNDDLAMKSPFIRLGGAGDIDIGADNGKGRMNYLAKASVVANASGQGGQGLEHLKGLTVPVRITGPFDKLAYKLEIGDLVSDAAKAKVEEKKQEVKAKVEDKVKDKLKGLLGR